MSYQFTPEQTVLLSCNHLHKNPTIVNAEWNLLPLVRYPRLCCSWEQKVQPGTLEESVQTETYLGFYSGLRSFQHLDCPGAPSGLKYPRPEPDTDTYPDRRCTGEQEEDTQVHPHPPRV